MDLDQVGIGNWLYRFTETSNSHIGQNRNLRLRAHVTFDSRKILYVGLYTNFKWIFWKFLRLVQRVWQLPYRSNLETRLLVKRNFRFTPNLIARLVYWLIMWFLTNDPYRSSGSGASHLDEMMILGLWTHGTSDVHEICYLSLYMNFKCNFW